MLTKAREGRKRKKRRTACTAQPFTPSPPAKRGRRPLLETAPARPAPRGPDTDARSASAGPQGGHPTTLLALISTPVHTQWSQRRLFLLGAAVRPDEWVSEEPQHFPGRWASYGFLRPRVPRQACRLGSAVQDLSPAALKAAPPTWGLGGSAGASRGRGWGSTPGIPGPQGRPDGQSHLRPQ